MSNNEISPRSVLLVDLYVRVGAPAGVGIKITSIVAQRGVGVVMTGT